MGYKYVGSSRGPGAKTGENIGPRRHPRVALFLIGRRRISPDRIDRIDSSAPVSIDFRLRG
jgi:hypothetical protein